ncbi:PC4-domain-containing protein [Corynespora cassiicola Philippines]|uniref:PC4-domain-containing protein n=1 Tax=Corynespora cassiicola Philippines TaxID=1448308 RepID=A0A2T2N7U4_CORCC|nr:PC4-domain-containing protein [Corynespora cassiicola Philippines]
MPPKAQRGRGGFKNFSKKRSAPADDDEPVSPIAKKARSEQFVPKELETADNGDKYVALKENGLRRITIGEWKGSTMIGIREYYQKNGETLPGKGISLTIEQYNALMAALPFVESALKERDEDVARPEFDAPLPQPKEPSPSEEPEAEEPEAEEPESS